MASSRTDYGFKLPAAPVLVVLFAWVAGSCLAQPPAPPTCNMGDSAALLEFKNGLGFQSGQRTQFDSWVPGTNCCDGWIGVTCGSTGRVTKLGQLFFSGTITPTGAAAVGRLDALETIIFWNFIFNQSIPKAWGQLHKLTELTMNECHFIGPIPKEIGGLSSLQTLSLQPAPVGPLPVEICQLRNIEIVTMQPGITGYLPNCIYNWTKVQKIMLQGNNLTGVLPPALGTLSTLTLLYLYDNKLYGPIPPTVGGLHSLQFLYLQNNFISGPLPKELGLLQNLQDLELTNNRIWGTIPPEVGNMSSLLFLNIASNRLWGQLPDSIGRMPEVRFIELSNNNLYGTLPLNLGFTPKLFNLHLNSNRFWGRIHVSIINNVSDIALDNNYFSGPLPSDGILFDGLDKDGTISVANNRLTGGVPLYLLTRFYVNLSQNRLSITRQLGQLPAAHYEAVRSLYLSHNKFSGPIPSWLFTGRTSLQSLDISFNKFSGSMPAGLFDIPRIVELDVSSNQLSSGLPVAPFSSVPRFSPIQSFLNLSHNAFDGSIPASFFAGVSDYIAFLDLSDNQLSGTLQGIDNLTAGGARYLDFSNNHLTGSIPDSIGSLVNLEHLDLSDNDLSGTIPASIAALPSLTYEDFSGNPNLIGS